MAATQCILASRQQGYTEYQNEGKKMTWATLNMVRLLVLDSEYIRKKITSGQQFSEWKCLVDVRG